MTTASGCSFVTSATGSSAISLRARVRRREGDRLPGNRDAKGRPAWQPWLLEAPDSFHPLAIGEDYLEAWATPQWSAAPVLSATRLQHDPRPDAGVFQPPAGYVQARVELQAALRQGSSADELVETVAIGERMRDEAFRKIADRYLDEYAKWLKQDYDSAIWADVVTVHRLDPNGAGLNSYPHAMLLTPLHPARFGWQCVAQALLQHAIDHRLRCPAASILDPRATPDCLVLPCRTPVGKIASRASLSVASNSDYWGVFWSGDGDQLRSLEDEAGRLIFDKEFGITIDGLASGFSVPQVERAIDEIAQIWAAKSTLRISVTSDTRGSSSCNEGSCRRIRDIILSAAITGCRTTTREGQAEPNIMLVRRLVKATDRGH